MSFSRHGEIYRSDGLGFVGAGRRARWADAPAHRLNEFPAGYSLAGCSPAEPASASPAEEKFTMKAAPQASFFQRTGKTCLAGCLTVGVHYGNVAYAILNPHPMLFRQPEDLFLTKLAEDW